jgi:parvulin-like peptidyl-prolyl isomerase
MIFRYLSILLLVLMAACSGGKTVATVDGEKISSNDLVQKMRMEMVLYDSAILSDDRNFDSFRRQALDNLIQEAVLLGEARRLGVGAGKEGATAVPEIMVGKPDLPDSDALAKRGIDEERWRETQRKRALIRKLIEKEVVEKIPVADKEVEKYYKKHITDYRDNTRFHARQILVDKKEIADRLHARLMKGEEFATLAKEFSVSPDAAKGGDLGFFDANAYPEVFADICQQLSPGEISKVKATPYSHQIFQLIAKRPPRQRSMDEVRDRIERKLKEQRIEEVFAPWLEELMKRAKVSVNEDALKEVKLNG